MMVVRQMIVRFWVTKMLPCRPLPSTVHTFRVTASQVALLGFTTTWRLITRAVITRLLLLILPKLTGSFLTALNIFTRRSAATASRIPAYSINDVALEKALPTSLLHLDRGQLVIRAEVQNIANHNNVGPDPLPSVNLLYVGTSDFMNISEAREGAGSSGGNRNLRFWAKFTF